MKEGDAGEPAVEAKPRSAAFYVVLAAALFAFIETFPLLSPILLSFLLTILIALAVNPVISRIRGWMGGRKLAVGVVAGIFLLGLGLTGLAFSGPLQSSVTKLAEQLPVYWDRLQKPLIKMEQQAQISEEKLQAEVTTEIAETAAAEGEPAPVEPPFETPPAKSTRETGSLRSSLSEMLKGVAGSFTSVAVNAAQILVVLVTVFFGVTFTLMNPRPIFGAIFTLVPERHHPQALNIVRRIGKFLPAWAGAVLLGMASIGLLVFVLMWPIFGFMDALVLGIIAAIMEAIPYIGPLLSAVPALLLALGEGGMTPLWVVAAYLSVQALENNVLTPLIMTHRMNLHPVAVIFAMLLCVAAFGVLGVLVATPLVGIVDILHQELYRKRFLPSVTDADVDRLARHALHEKPSAPK